MRTRNFDTVVTVCFGDGGDHDFNCKLRYRVEEGVAGFAPIVEIVDLRLKRFSGQLAPTLSLQEAAREIANEDQALHDALIADNEGQEDREYCMADAA